MNLCEIGVFHIVWGVLKVLVIIMRFCENNVLSKIYWYIWISDQIGKSIHFWKINIFTKTAEFAICVQIFFEICAMNEEILKDVINIHAWFQYPQHWPSLQSMTRVPNISLLIYIGLLGLHPNSCQDLITSCPLTYIYIYIYIFIYWVARCQIHFGWIAAIYYNICNIYIDTCPSRWHRVWWAAAGELRREDLRKFTSTTSLCYTATGWGKRPTGTRRW